MAKIDFSKLRKGSLIKPDLNDAKELLKVLNDIEKGMVDIAKARKQAANVKSPFETAEEIDAFTKLTEEVNALLKEHNKIKTASQKLNAKIAASTSNEATELAKLKVQQQEVNKAQKQAAKEALGLVGAYEKESKRLIRLRKEFKDLRVEEGKSTKESRKLLKEITKLDRELKDVDESTGQFQRSVGDYGKAVGEATSQTLGWLAALGGVAGGLATVTKGIQENEEASRESAGVTARLGAAADAVTNRIGRAGKALFDVFTGRGGGQTGLNALFRLTGAFDGLTDEIAENAAAAEEAAIKNFDLERAQLALRQQVAVLNAEIEKQNVIAGDSTRSFDEQAAAIRRVTKAQIARTSILVDIAAQELAILETQQAARAEDANNFAIEAAISEKRIELTEIQGELVAQQLENSKIAREVERDRFELGLDFAIDAFDSQKTVNERLIADDRKTLTERGEIFERTVELSESAFTEQIKLTEGFLGQQTNLRELVLEEDERVIRERLKAFTADEITLIRILEIIRERKIVVQDLADAERDLGDAASESIQLRINALRALEAEQSRGRVDELQRQLDNVKLSGAQRREITLELFKEQRKDLENQAVFEEAFVAETNEEILVVREKLKNDVIALKKSEVAALKVISEQERKDRIQRQTEIAKAITDIIIENSQKRVDALNDELAAREKREDQLLRLAEQGSEDARDNLAFEQQKQAELRLEREKEIKRQQRIELGLTALNIYSAKVNAGDGNALASTIADTTLLLAFIRNLPAFYEGIENTGKGGNADDKGGFLATLHPEERVMTAKQNKKVGDLSNDDLAEAGRLYNEGQLMDRTEFDGSRVIQRFRDDAAIVGSVERVVKEIQELPGKIDIPEVSTHYHALEESFIKTVSKRKGLTNYHKKVNNLF